MRRLSNLFFSLVLLVSTLVVFTPIKAANNVGYKISGGYELSLSDTGKYPTTALKKDDDVDISFEISLSGFDASTYNKIKSSDFALEMDSGSSFKPRRSTDYSLKVTEETGNNQLIFTVSAEDISYYGSGSEFSIVGDLTLTLTSGGTETVRIKHTFIIDETNDVKDLGELKLKPYILKYEVTTDKVSLNDPFSIAIQVVDPNFKYAQIPSKELDGFYAVLTGNSFAAADRSGYVSKIGQDSQGYLTYYVVFDKVRYLAEGNFGFTVGYAPKVLIDRVTYTAKQQVDLTFSVLETAGSSAASGTYAPKVLVNSYTGQNGVVAGKTLNFTVTFKNNSTTTSVHNVVIGVNGNDAFAMAKGVNKFFIDTIEPQQEITINLSMNAAKTATPGSHPISFKGSYDFGDGKESGVIEGEIAVPVTQLDRININYIKINNVYTNSEAEVNYSIVNTGMSTILNANLEILDDAGAVLGSVYLGKIAAGAESKGTNMYLTFAQAGELNLKGRLIYEDENFNTKEVSNSFKIMVNDNGMGGGGGMIFPQEPGGGNEVEEPVKKNNNSMYFVVGILIVLVGAGGFVVYRRKKNQGKINDENL